MMIDNKSYRSMSADSGDKRRFVPGYDFSYRFQSAKPFLELKAPQRPHTTPSGSSAQTYRTGRHQQAYVNAIASAQTPSIEAIKQSLGDGLIMLQQGHKFVKPDVFANLDKIHLREIKVTTESRSVKSPAFHIPRQPPIPTQSPIGGKTTKIIPPYIRSQSAGSATTQSRGIQVDRSHVTPTNATRRPSTVGEMVVEFLTNVEKREQHSNNTKLYRPRSNSYYSTITEYDDRCLRNSDFPQIQIDGRALSHTLRTGTGYMPREHCDVLGPQTCPDCIRTRSQNSHQRMCSTAVAANATDVYKLALIHERIPHLGIREVQRKVFDGEISDKINSISRWNEIRQQPQPKAEQDENIAETVVTIDEKSTDQPEKIRPRLRSRGSIGSVAPVFETIAEASESPEIEQNKSGINEVSEGQQEESEQQAVKTEQQDLSNKDDMPRNETLTEKKTAHDVLGSTDVPKSPEHRQRTPSSKSRRRSNNRKKSPKRNVRIFNRGLIPSPNYFYNVSDLVERIKKLRRSGKRNPWEIDIDISMPAIQQDETGRVLRPDVNKDEVSSISSQDSVSPRKSDPMTKVEPPIMFEKKSRYLGLPHPTIGNTSIRV